MPSWITIYCRKPVAGVTSTHLLRGMLDRYCNALAEQFGLPDELARGAAMSIGVEEVEAIDVGDLPGIRLHYRRAGEGNVDIERWVDPPRVAEAIGEARKKLGGVTTESAGRIEAHLREAKAVVAMEIRPGRFKEMGVVLAFEVARWFAEQADGIVWDDDDQWYHIEDGGLRPF